jgi:hypothetical protein
LHRNIPNLHLNDQPEAEDGKNKFKFDFAGVGNTKLPKVEFKFNSKFKFGSSNDSKEDLNSKKIKKTEE